MRCCMLLCLCVLLSLSASTKNSIAAETTRPNVVVILADDLGYSDLGCYGGEIRTPHLDALAAGGLRYSQFYNTARCWPSRAVLLTGYYAQQIRRDAVPGVQSGARGIRPQWAKLLPELLKAQGYRAYHSGKWHVDGRPLQTGFDRSFEIGGGQNSYFKSQGNAEEGLPLAARENYYVTTAVAEHAVKCLREHAAEHHDRPFFQYVCFTAPHFPLHALPEDIARYRETYRIGWDNVQVARYERQKKIGLVTTALPRLERDVGPPYHFPKAFEILGPGEINRPLPWRGLNDAQQAFQAAKMSLHAAMIDRMDQEIGRLVAQLKEMHAFDNTLILFASDNGASAEIMVRGDGHDPAAAPGSAETYLCLGPGWSSAANTPFRRHKTWVHEGGISTPLIAHWPRGIRGTGELRHSPAHLIDVVPTVLEITGTPPPVDATHPIPPTPGQSLAATFTHDVRVARDFLWWQHEDNRAVRVGDWKLVAAGKDAAWELYDLSRDRAESHNLATEQPDRVRELARLWERETEKFRQLALRDATPAKKRSAD